MGWRDDFALLDGYLPSSTASGYQTFRSRIGGSSFSPRPRQKRFSWSDMASGSLAPARATSPTSPLEKFDVSLPYSSTGPRSPYAPRPLEAPQSTKGDFIGSLAGAAESVVTNLTLGNVTPWLMERFNVAANDLAATIDVPVVNEGLDAFAAGTDAFIDAVDAASQVAAPVLDTFPTWIRDSQLGDRAKLYRAIANGETPDYGWTGSISNPLASINQLLMTPVVFTGSAIARAAPEGPLGDVGRFLQGGGPTGALLGQTVSLQASEAAYWQKELLTSVDPNRRMTAEQRMSILRDSIDLPESVKLLIESKPGATDDEIARFLDEAPEGKQWSYDPGPSGVVQNMGTPIALYLIEARAGLRAGGGVAARGLASTAPGVAKATVGAGRVAAGTQRLLAASLASGIGITAVNTTMGAIARYVGDDEAVRWFDNANRTSEFSDDLNVQLVTGFGVPIGRALNMATRGGASKVGGAVKRGLIDVPLKAITRRKVEKFYGSPAVITDMTRRMFKLRSNDEAETFLDAEGIREMMPDRILATAANIVFDRLPSTERMAWRALYPDPIERTAAAMSRWSGDALDLIEKDPDFVASRFYADDWQYRMSTLPFNASYAAKVMRDFRRAEERTYDIRARQNGVVGYREQLPPQGQALARAAVEEDTVDGAISMDALTGIVVDLPVLRKYLGGFVRSTDATIQRDVVDGIIDRASADWAIAAKVNPIRAATGADPIIRPDSPTLMRDYAEALGTNIDTVLAIRDFDPKSAAHVELLEAFLRDKTKIDPAGKSPQEVWAAASGFLDETTRDWVDLGSRIASAEGQLTRLRGELDRVRREGGREQSDRTITLQRQINELAADVRLAGDPVETYAQTAAGVRKSVGGSNLHLAEMAARRVDALDRLRVLQSIDDDLKTAGLTEVDLGRVVVGADGELADIADVLGAPPAPVIDSFIDWKGRNTFSGGFNAKSGTGAGRTARFTPNPSGNERYLSELGQAPAAFQWSEMTRGGFVKAMRAAGDQESFPTSGMTGSQVADIVEAAAFPKGWAGNLDTAAEAWGLDRAGTLRRLAEFRKARETALDGKGIAAIKRTSTIKVPGDYIAQAEADRAARALVYDAEYDAFWHPRNVAKVVEITDRAADLWPGLREVIKGDPALEAGIAAVAAKSGRSVDDILSDPAAAAAVRKELVPEGFEPPIEGMVREWTDLDYLITSGDQDAIAALAEQAAVARNAQRPPIKVTKEVADSLSKMPTSRRSYQYRRRLSDSSADFKAPPAERILNDPANKLGVDVLSVLNHGTIGTKPATIQGVIALLRDIEDGAAGRIGLGPELQAEGQRVARDLLDDAVRTAKRTPEDAGTFSAGFFAEDEQALAATINDLLSFDVADPLGTLQYGLKKAPKDAIVMEWSKVPGLAEELLSKRFQSFDERVGTTQVRQSFNFVFGDRSNDAIRAETRNRFAERLAREGVTPETARAVWDDWYTMSRQSRKPSLRRRKTGEYDYESGDSPLYADVWNVPNARMQGSAHGVDAQPGTLQRLWAGGKMTSTEYAAARRVDYARAFRESASFTRRTIADSRIPLGRAIADAYGAVAHNEAATTLYYWFRFGLDVRYHAMNYLEAQILYAGRAGLRKGEIDEGLIGATKSNFRKIDNDPANNTGYSAGRDRFAWAYRTFLKEQPDALRKGLRGLASEDPETMRRAMDQLARNDPQLRNMIDAMGATPEKYLDELDASHRKMLGNIDEANDGRTIDEALAKEMADTPELAEVFGRLGQVNKELWADIRGTFYGNPNRSRAERFLNSYLLFWPISYQIKSTKWLLRVLFDRAGGIQTNALGAVTLDRLAETHNRLLATDVEYRDWYERNDTLVFVAQMLLPVSFDSTGVSLNRGLRSMFFDRTLAVSDIGPIYTFNKVIRPAADELYVDLYPTLGDFPPFDGLYRGLTGRREPEVSE